MTQLLISSRDRLEARFRSAGAARIVDAFLEYASALDRTGTPATVVLVDDPDYMDQWGVPAVDSSSGDGTLRGARALARQDGGASGITILGGPHIVPFVKLPNPVRDRSLDADGWVLTDAPYGSDGDTMGDYVEGMRPVGRLPDPGTRNADAFIETIELQIANHEARRKRAGSTAIFNCEWDSLASQVAESLPAEVTKRSCPDYRVMPETISDLDRAYLYFNLHGFERRHSWDAYEESRARFVPVVRPGSLQREQIAGSVIFCDNCYGAAIERRTARSSCALKSVAEGVAAFVGPTGLASASHLPPRESSRSHDLARRFLEHHTGNGGAGVALQRARREYFGNAVRDNLLDPYEKKTALQYVVLGDPLL